MSDLDIWLSVAGLTLATVVARAGMLWWPMRNGLSPRLERALRYAPACALAAIVVPDVVLGHADPAYPWANPRLLAALLAAVVFWHTRSMLWTIVSGMAALTALRLLLG